MASTSTTAANSDRVPHHAALTARFQQVRAATERLVAPITAEDMSLQSMPDASPTKWHLAHTTWFFETFVLEAFERDFHPFDARFRVLFNSYYNAVGDKHPRHERGLISRPDVATVLRYRADVTARVTNLLQALQHQPHDVALLARVTELIVLGCNHEEQHQELIFTDLKHLLSKNPARPALQPRWPLTRVEARNTSWVRHQGGLVEIGADAADVGGEFHFDNESPRHKVWLAPFELASHPVSHTEFAAFVDAGGYQNPEWWLSMGWDWVRQHGITAPMYWTRTDNGWHTFTLHGMVPLDAATPVCHLNYFEADAFARWSGARLPTEAEWEHAAASLSVEGNFLDGEASVNALHPLAPQSGESINTLAQMFGDVWEWTSSSYAAYPGFRPAPGAVGEYNGKFMCNQYVLRGGSCVSPRGHVRKSYRNFFPPDARWQFSGLRLARDA